MYKKYVKQRQRSRGKSGKSRNENSKTKKMCQSRDRNCCCFWFAAMFNSVDVIKSCGTNNKNKTKQPDVIYIYICINIKNVVKEEKDTSNLPRAMWAQRKLTLKRITACQRLVFCDQLSLSPFLHFSCLLPNFLRPYLRVSDVVC